MKREFSAGGIVFQKNQQHVLWLVAQHSQHKGWVFPKGLIGDMKEHESKEETAVREVKEETGIVARIVEALPKSVQYFYTWQKEKRFKTVYYFLMEYVSGETKDHDWEMCDVAWLPTEEVEKRLSYSSDKEAFAAALTQFEKYHKPS